MNWIAAAFPDSLKVLNWLEEHNQTEIDTTQWDDWELQYPMLERLSAQIRATLVSLCDGEALKVVINSPNDERSGIEALRRLN